MEDIDAEEKKRVVVVSFIPPALGRLKIRVRMWPSWQVNRGAGFDTHRLIQPRAATHEVWNASELGLINIKQMFQFLPRCHIRLVKYDASCVRAVRRGRGSQEFFRLRVKLQVRNEYVAPGLEKELHESQADAYSSYEYVGLPDPYTKPVLPEPPPVTMAPLPLSTERSMVLFQCDPQDD